jgi:hypothetical protein
MLPDTSFFDLFSGRHIEPENKLAYAIMDLKTWKTIDKELLPEMVTGYAGGV